MTIHTVSKTNYVLRNNNNEVIGSLVYSNDQLSEATITTADTFKLQLIADGVWATTFNNGFTDKVMTKIQDVPGSGLLIRLFYQRKKYLLKKTGENSTSFSLLGPEGEVLMTISAEPKPGSQFTDWVIQQDEKVDQSIDLFLVLQAVHCAVCWL
jgi:hypothetical protein